ncbi:PcfJ domain-containing protein [Agrobacterium salinitolerans]|nr:PcfJ domain-containing protein [Agrobacterium salinitolerans]
MAGTGHKYEVSNPTRVAEYAFELRMQAAERDLETAEAWLRSKHFLKYLTSEAFTFRIKPAHVTNSTIPDEKRQHIFSKVLAGDEVRRFDSVLFETLGPDIAHVLDWIAELKTTGNPTYRKIARMETSVLVAKADAWTKSLNSKRWNADGTVQPVLAITNDLIWFELKDSRALKWEGSQMLHCVGGENYADSLARGNTRIYSLRKGGNKPILTLEARFNGERFSLLQIQKKCNGGLPVAYCDAAVALLNALDVRDDYNAAHRHALCYGERHWTTVFDTWDVVEFHGRKVLTDGKSILFMCVTDAAKPLAILDYAITSGDAGNWFETDYDPKYVRLREADDMQPHYLDQVECCAIANILSKGNPTEASSVRFNWMRIRDDAFVPYVDTLERVDMDDSAYYAIRDSKGEAFQYHLPHSGDPARLLVTAIEKDRRLTAHINAGQRISRAETQRVLAFLTATKTKWIDHEAEGACRNATRDFVAACGPEHLPGDEWRSFAADMVETAAKGTSGKWQETDYLLRYLQNDFGKVNIYLNDRSVSYLFGSWIEKKDLIEISSKLRERRIVSDDLLLLDMYGDNDRYSALFMRNGRWTWVNEKNFVSRAKETLDAAEKNPNSVSTPVLSGILGRICYLLKKDGARNREVLSDLKSRLLVAWFLRTPTFDKVPFRRFRFLPLFGEKTAYPVIDRLIDLADQGFKLDDKKANAQFRKFLQALSASYGKERIPYAEEQEYFELLVRWHRHLPRKYLNKVSSTWISCDLLTAPSDGPARILEILDNPDTSRTRFREAVFSLAERLVADTDYESVEVEALDGFARLFLAVVKARYIYGRNLEALARLVPKLERTGAGDPDTRAELRTRLDNIEERERRHEAKAA